MTAKVETNAEKIAAQIRSIQTFKWVAAPTQRSALYLKGLIAPYAPASDANSPGKKRYYKRGTGTIYRRADGSVKTYKTSETMGRRWKITSRRSGRAALLENKASYSAYVQSEELQASWHKRRGWKTDQQVIIQGLPRIGAFYLRSFAQVMRFVK